MKTFRLIPMMILLVFFFAQGCKNSDTGVLVTTDKIRGGTPINTEYIMGKTEAADSVTIVPKVGGKVSYVGVDVGSRVKAGQVLMKIDMSDVEAQMEQQRVAINNAEAGIKQAQLDLDTAKANYDRAKSLYDSGALSKADFENKYQVPYEQAKLRAEEIAPNALAQAKAALQTLEVNYSNSVITSPIDGEVTARNVNPGEICSPTKTAFSVADLSGMVVSAYVKEEMINSIKVGQKVSVKIDSVDGMQEAEVKNISAEIDPVAKGYKVKFRILNPTVQIKPGMFARVYSGDVKAGEFVIPKTALSGDGGSYWVFIYEGGKVSKVPVTVVKMSDNYVVIAGGVSEGQDVVVSSSSGLADGMSVKER
ncbi:MAG: efflux RND transporter periplasmic adaptor subunit [Bacillota bacterium]